MNFILTLIYNFIKILIKCFIDVKFYVVFSLKYVMKRVIFFFKIVFRIVFFIFMLLFYDFFIKIIINLINKGTYFILFLYNYFIIRKTSIKILILKLSKLSEEYSHFYKNYFSFRKFFFRSKIFYYFFKIVTKFNIFFFLKKIINIARINTKKYFYIIFFKLIFILINFIRYTAIFFVLIFTKIRKLFSKFYDFYLNLKIYVIRLKIWILLFFKKKNLFLYKFFMNLKVGYFFLVLYFYLTLLYPAMDSFISIYNDLQWKLLHDNINWYNYYAPENNYVGGLYFWFFSIFDVADFFLLKMYLSIAYFLTFIPHFRTLWFKEKNWDSSVLDVEFDDFEEVEEDEDPDADWDVITPYEHYDMDSDDLDQTGTFINDYHDELRDKSYVIGREHNFTNSNSSYIGSDGWGSFISVWIFMFYYAIKMIFWPNGSLKIPFFPGSDLLNFFLTEKGDTSFQFTKYYTKDRDISVYYRWMPGNALSYGHEEDYVGYYSNRYGQFSQLEIPLIELKYIRQSRNMWANWDQSMSYRNLYRNHILRPIRRSYPNFKYPMSNNRVPHFLGTLDYTKILDNDSRMSIDNEEFFLLENRPNYYSSIDSFNEVYGVYPFVNKNINFYYRSVFSSKNYLNNFYNTYTTLAYWPSFSVNQLNNQHFNNSNELLFNNITGRHSLSIINYMNSNLNAATSLNSNYGIGRIWTNLIQKRDMSLQLPLTYNMADNLLEGKRPFFRFPMNSISFSEIRIRKRTTDGLFNSAVGFGFPISYDYGVNSKDLKTFNIKTLMFFYDSNLLFDKKLSTYFSKILRTDFYKNYEQSHYRQLLLKIWYEHQEGKFPGLKLYTLARQKYPTFYDVVNTHNEFFFRYKFDNLSEYDQEEVLSEVIDTRWALYDNNNSIDYFDLFTTEAETHEFYDYYFPSVFFYYNNGLPRYLREYAGGNFSLNQNFYLKDQYSYNSFFRQQNSRKFVKQSVSSGITYFNKLNLRNEGYNVVDYFTQYGRYIDDLMTKEKNFRKVYRYRSLYDSLYDLVLVGEIIDFPFNFLENKNYLRGSNFSNYYNYFYKFYNKFAYYIPSGKLERKGDYESSDDIFNNKFNAWNRGIRSLPIPYFGKYQMQEIYGGIPPEDELLNFRDYEDYLNKHLVYFKYISLDTNKSGYELLDSMITSPLFSLWYTDYFIYHFFLEDNFENFLPYQLYIKDESFVLKKEMIINLKSLTLSQHPRVFTDSKIYYYFVLFYKKIMTFLYPFLYDVYFGLFNSYIPFKDSDVSQLIGKIYHKYFYFLKFFVNYSENTYFFYDDFFYKILIYYAHTDIFFVNDSEFYMYGLDYATSNSFSMLSLKSLSTKDSNLLYNYFFIDKNESISSLLDVLDFNLELDYNHNMQLLDPFYQYNTNMLFYSVKSKYVNYPTLTISDSLFYDLEYKYDLLELVFTIDFDDLVMKDRVFFDIAFNDNFWYSNHILWYVNTYDLNYLNLNYSFSDFEYIKFILNIDIAAKDED